MKNHVIKFLTPLLRLAERLGVRKKPISPWMKRLAWAGLIVVALVIGLGISITTYNRIEDRKENNVEVTFVDPRQAVVFWTTEVETKGYVKYGATPQLLNQTAHQTSSEPGTIHAVLLTDVPLGGMYYSIHTEADSIVRQPKIQHMVYDPTAIE